MQLRERRTGFAYGDLATHSRTVNIKNNQTGPPEWINVELGVNYSVRQFVLKRDAINRYAAAYAIQTSTDGTNWTTVYSTSNVDGGTDTISFSTATARYVR